MENIRIIIVEDDFLAGQDLENLCQQAGFEVLLNIQSGEDLFKAPLDRVDIILMDIDLNEQKDGIQLAEEMKAIHGIPVIFISGKTDPFTLARIRPVSSGQFNFLTKPAKLTDLSNLVHHWSQKKPTLPQWRKNAFLPDLHFKGEASTRTSF